jgi:hypothetical protein
MSEEPDIAERKLTELQIRFIEAVVADPHRDRTKAAIAAGYAPEYASELGSQLWRKPHVRAEIKRRIREQGYLCGIDERWVLIRLRQLYDRAMLATPIKDKRGNPTGGFRRDLGTAHAALRTLAQYLGMLDGDGAKRANEPPPINMHMILPTIKRVWAELQAAKEAEAAIVGCQVLPTTGDSMSEPEVIPPPGTENVSNLQEFLRIAGNGAADRRLDSRNG